MRRRAVLAGVAGLAATAGCLSVPDSDDSHPFAGESVTVGIDADSESPHDLRAITRTALEFWTQNSERYAGFTVEFETVESSDPDVVVAYADSPEGCSDVEGYSERVLGCAPRLQADTELPDPVVARVVAGDRPPGQIQTTAKHELGHVLGLGHGDQPRAVMSSRPEDRIPMYDQRVETWETIQAGTEQTGEGNSLYGQAIERYNSGEYEAAKPAFETARETLAGAADRFDTARESVKTLEAASVDVERIQSRLAALAERVSLLVSAAEAMTEAADAAATGDNEVANKRRSVANKRTRAFREGGSIQAGDIAAALGLVRDTDREDSATGPDGDGR